MTTTPLVFGDSRTHIARRHALIAPDGHVPSSLPGVDRATTVVLISRELGARFTQVLLTFETDGSDIAGLLFVRLNDAGKFSFQIDQVEIR